MSVNPSSPSFRKAVLDSLDFGMVDSESESDLDRRFLRTADFDKFLKRRTRLILGAKGTGKSALFELFTKHEDLARRLAPESLADVWITAGTGYSDLSEVATIDLQGLQGEEGYDHELLWKLYIAVRGILAISDSSHIPNGPAKEFLRALGRRKDFRVGPVLRSLWTLAIGRAPAEITLSLAGNSVKLSGSGRPLDVMTFLEDVQSTLEAEGKDLWMLFDKIDELFPSDRNERKKALEGLLTASMDIERKFPRIRPKILLRTDLWSILDFTNKSHYLDKQFTLSWSRNQIVSLLLKRAIMDSRVRIYVATQVDALEGAEVESLSGADSEKGLTTLLPPSAYVGTNEAAIVDWILLRITDGQNTVLPRESIILCNYAQQHQEKFGPDSPSIIGRRAMLEAFSDLSKARCATYLAEFPELKEHFSRFEGLTTSSFSRSDMLKVFEGLTPGSIEAVDKMCEIGVLRPDRPEVRSANNFEVPRLYRVGLGLVIRGRP